MTRTALPHDGPSGKPPWTSTGAAAERPTPTPPRHRTHDRRYREEALIALWCELTRTSPNSLGDPEREAFLARPQAPVLCTAPEPVLREAGAAVVKGHSLPLERWLAATRAAAGAAAVG